MTRFPYDTHFRPVMGYYVIMGVMCHSYYQDPVDTYWHLLTLPHLEGVNPLVPRMKWLFDNRIDFTIEMECEDALDEQNWSELVRFFIVIRDPGQAVLYKLTWGGE